MNPAYLLSLLLVALVAAAFWVGVTKARLMSAAETICIAGGVLTSVTLVALLVGSFAGATGSPVTVETTQFMVERTPYRVVISAFDQEATLKDAFTMAAAQGITRVKRTTQRNAWGVELSSPPNQPTLTPVFMDMEAAR